MRGSLGEHASKLAALPQLTQLTTLDLGKLGFTDRDLIALLASPHLGNLRVLDLTENSVSEAGIDALAAASKSLPNLEAVGLQLNRAKDPTDRVEYADTTPRYVARDEGKALEGKYGTLRWLHPNS